VLITGTTTGVLDDVEFKRGYADILGKYIDSLLDTNGIFSSTSTSIQSQIEDISDDRASLQRRLTTIEARLRSQFTALDLLVSQLQSTSSYLSQQLATLPTVGESRK
jgi:flagellar hook-associated protein 2